MHSARLVRRLFSLPKRRQILTPIPPAVLVAATPGPGEITLITGPSGGGKSRLLRALRDRSAPPQQWLDPTTLPLGTACVVDRVCDALDPAGPAKSQQQQVEIALALLSRVGLAEAWTYLQTPDELSDGQRWRLMLALAVAEAVKRGDRETTAVIAADEFAALLDRVTARIVARALRRLVDRPGGPNVPRLAAVVATSHEDLIAALSPDRVIYADFGEYRWESPGGP